MNTKNQTNLSQLVIEKYERLQKKKKQNKKKKNTFSGLYAYQNVLLCTYLQHKSTFNTYLNVTLLRGLELGTFVS